MTFKDIAKKLTTSIQTLPELIRILAEGLEKVEAGSQSEDYSTTEKEIGKWIDGKTLYKKTIKFTTGNSDAYLTYDTGIENPDTIFIDFSASFYEIEDAINNAIPYFGTLASGDSNVFEIICNKVDNKIRIDYRLGNSAYSKPATVTIKYTKAAT